MIIRILNAFLIIALSYCRLLADYDPSVATDKQRTSYESFTYEYKGDDRTVKLRVYSPERKTAPVILLSHGLGGSRDTGAYLARHWAGRGFIVVAMQHAGSDQDVIRDAPRGQKLIALKRAADLESFMQRPADVTATIEQISRWNAQKGHDFHRAFDLLRIAIGGHSFGAITSQACSGQSFPANIGTRFTDKRILAAVLMSPSEAKGGRNGDAFGHIIIPWLCMTGTNDTSPITPTVDVEDRKQVFAHLPATGNKYQLVLNDAQHLAFSDRSRLGLPQRNKNHHKVIIALSTAFYEAHLAGNEEALIWLQSEAPGKLLEAGDAWERK